MPRRLPGYTRMETLPLEERLRHDGPFQRHWYALAAALVGSGRTIIDVGSGSGSGLEEFVRWEALDIVGIDPLPLGPRVHAWPVESIATKSWDVVTAFDVIEHVEDDVGFLAELFRIARSYVFFSTPNWHAWHAANAFHVREYTPAELKALLVGHKCRWFTSGADCVPHERQDLPDDLEDLNFGVLILI